LAYCVIKGQQFTPDNLQEMGRMFAQALVKVIPDTLRQLCLEIDSVF
jgi:hypothetical protein